MSSSDLSRRTLRFRAAFYVFGGAAIVAMLVLLTINSTTGLTARSTNAKSLRLLVECTTPPELRTPPERNVPKSDCYVRSQSQQADIIGDPPAPINNVVILAAYCARIPTNDTEANVRNCVLKGLKR